jgi:hypothetical protein
MTSRRAGEQLPARFEGEGVAVDVAPARDELVPWRIELRRRGELVEEGDGCAHYLRGSAAERQLDPGKPAMPDYVGGWLDFAIVRAR